MLVDAFKKRERKKHASGISPEEGEVDQALAAIVERLNNRMVILRCSQKKRRTKQLLIQPRPLRCGKDHLEQVLRSPG